MDALKRIGTIGLVPVVVVQTVDEALKAADALAQGGVPIMEITLRTAAGLDAIRAVRSHNPDILVGAGTVITLAQCQAAVEAGAQFIVSPGFDPQVADWCVQNNVPLTPGCVTPTEITAALSKGINVLKFFPASIYGGIKACAALQGPFKSADVKFVPTGGIDLKNLHEYADKPYIHAIGGGWLCDPKSLQAGDFDAIRKTAQESVKALLGFEFAHLGINTDNEAISKTVADSLDDVFGFAAKYGNSSNFAGGSIEVMKSDYLGTSGHIAVKTNSIERAIAYLEQKGCEVDLSTAKYKGKALNSVYLTKEFGGFAIHLLQK